MQPEHLPLRVLVVDDEPLICWSLSETLSDCGDVVSSVGTGAAAVRALCEEHDPVDVVLLDYNLPDVDQLTLLSTVRRLSPNTRVILITAYGTPDIARNALALGACAVVNKPIDMHDVPLLIHRAPWRSPR